MWMWIGGRQGHCAAVACVDERAMTSRLVGRCRQHCAFAPRRDASDVRFLKMMATRWTRISPNVNGYYRLQKDIRRRTHGRIKRS